MTGTELDFPSLRASPPPARKRLHVITWGCQMNVYDSHRMSDVLAPLGYAPADTPEGADMVILNTCHIRDKAAEKVFSELGRLRRLKQATGGRMILAVAGCVAQAEGKEILARAPYVDIVLGPQTYHRLPEMVARAARAGGAVIETDFPAEDKFDHLPEQSAPQGVTAFLTVQEGCDKFCSFCVVPYTRGAEQSRPAAAILAEARRLIAQGSREITLLGQNVNAWHGEAPDGGTWGLGRLLRAVAELPGLARLRYATSHPRDMDDALIEAHRDLPLLMPFLHLPVQSGSDRILAAMNRKHTADDYRRLVRPAARRAAGSCSVIGLHRRPSGRNRRRFRGDDGAGARCRVRAGLQFQVFATARNSSGGLSRSGAGGGERPPVASVAGPAAGATGPLQRRLRRHHHERSVHWPWAPSWPDRWPVIISSPRSHHGFRQSHRRGTRGANP